MSDWDPDQYRRFDAERSAPFWDLIGLVEPDGVRRMVDLGCGDGELSTAAAARLGVDDLVGIDSSPAMIERAGRHASEHRIFSMGDLSQWPGPQWGGTADLDLVLANASLQWVPDHVSVLRRWTAGLAAGGQLAVQVPANGDHPSHVVADEVARLDPFLEAFDGEPPRNPTNENVLLPETYAALFHELGFERQHVSLRVYAHLLDSSADVAEWVRGTNLTRIFKRLPTELHEPFVDAYRTAFVERVGDHAPYFYAFKRILMWGRLDGSPRRPGDESDGASP